jgi:hypothetical protein
MTNLSARLLDFLERYTAQDSHTQLNAHDIEAIREAASRLSSPEVYVLISNEHGYYDEIVGVFSTVQYAVELVTEKFTTFVPDERARGFPYWTTKNLRMSMRVEPWVLEV